MARKFRGKLIRGVAWFARTPPAMTSIGTTSALIGSFRPIRFPLRYRTARPFRRAWPARFFSHKTGSHEISHQTPLRLRHDYRNHAAFADRDDDHAPGRNARQPGSPYAVRR